MTPDPRFPAPPADTAEATTVLADAGRDAGKTFLVAEVPPVEMATFVLRLLAAIRLSGVAELLALMAPAEERGETDIAVVLRLLAGCDPEAVRSLINDALAHVQVAADPRHPGMFRPLRSDDIREMATLGQVLGAFARANIATG